MNEIRGEWIDLYTTQGVAVQVGVFRNCPSDAFVCFDGKDIEVVENNVVPLDGFYEGSTINRALYGDDLMLIAKHPAAKDPAAYFKMYPKGLPVVTVRAANGSQVRWNTTPETKDIRIAWPTFE